MKKIQINKTPLLQIHIHPLVSIHIVLMVGTYFHLGHVTSLKSCSTQTATATTHIRPFHLKHRLRTLICIFTLLQITTVAGSTRHVLNTHTYTQWIVDYTWAVIRLYITGFIFHCPG